MPRPRSIEVRWLVIYKRLVLDDSWRDVSDALCGASKHFQEATIALFRRTGDVRGADHTGGRRRRGRRMTAAIDQMLLDRVLDDPTATLVQHSAAIWLSTGQSVSVSTVCRAMRRLGMTRLRVRSARDTLGSRPHAHAAALALRCGSTTPTSATRPAPWTSGRR